MRALFAWEYGSGMGHIARFNALAPLLAARGVDMVGVWGVLGNIDRAHPAIDVIVPAPIVVASPAGPWRDELVPVDRRIYSFAANLQQQGFDDARILGASQRAWRALLDIFRPDVIVADYAPGALIAAHGRIPVVQIGNWYSQPPGRDGYLAPYEDESLQDVATQDRILATINEVLTRRGAPALATLSDLFPDESCFPASFPDFDGHRASRTKPTIREYFGSVDLPQRRGDDIFAYFDPMYLHNEVLTAGLLRLDRPIRLVSSGLPKTTHDELRARGVVIESEPFTLEKIAREARLFVHHGGYGTTHLCAFAGVPQLLFFGDTEKRSHARGVERLGVGRAIEMSRLSIPAMREAAESLLEDEATAARARETATRFQSFAPERDIHELIMEATIAAASG